MIELGLAVGILAGFIVSLVAFYTRKSRVHIHVATREEADRLWRHICTDASGGVYWDREPKELKAKIGKPRGSADA